MNDASSEWMVVIVAFVIPSIILAYWAWLKTVDYVKKWRNK